jgi:hypothetical protein
VLVRRTEIFVVEHLLENDIKRNLKGCLSNIDSQYL